MFQMSLAKSSQSDHFENFFIWSEVDGPADNVQKLSNLHYVHLEAKNRICIQFKGMDTGRLITIHLQLKSTKKQQKYFECIKFLCENKFFI